MVFKILKQTGPCVTMCDVSVFASTYDYCPSNLMYGELTVLVSSCLGPMLEGVMYCFAVG